MTLSTFIGPDGSTLLHKHDSDTCECEECTAARWGRIEREARRVVGDLRRIEATQHVRPYMLNLPSCNTDLEDPIVQARLLATSEQAIQEAQEMDIFLESMRDSR